MIDSAKPLSQVEIDEVRTRHDHFCLVRFLATIDSAGHRDRATETGRPRSYAESPRRDKSDNGVCP